MLANLASLDPHEADKVASWLAERAAIGLEAMIDTLFRDAFAIWMTRSLKRLSDEEPCCAVVFYACCLEVLGSRETNLRIVPESDQPTREMLDGTAHPRHAPRPDMSILFGRHHTIRIEAKRLMLGEGLPGKYVREGMRRFIDGKYASTRGKPGYMLGFVVRDDTGDVVSSINRAITVEPDLGAGDQLGSMTNPLPRYCRCVSSHTGELRLIHNLLDIRVTR